MMHRHRVDNQREHDVRGSETNDRMDGAIGENDENFVDSHMKGLLLSGGRAKSCSIGAAEYCFFHADPQT